MNTYGAQPASTSSIVVPTAHDTVVVGGALNMVVMKSFREDGESSENNEGREELHGCVLRLRRKRTWRRGNNEETGGAGGPFYTFN